MLVREIFQRVQAAESAEPEHHIVRDRPFVETPAALFGDAAQGGGEQWLAHLVAQIESCAASPKYFCRHGIVRDLHARFGEVVSDARRHLTTLLRQTDRRLQECRHLACSVVGEQPEPGIDSTRHGHGVGGTLWDFVKTVSQIPIERSGRGSAAGSVESDRQPAFRRVENKTVAADAGHVRLGETEHRRRRNRGVDGVAAIAQYVDRRYCRQRMRRRRHRLVAHGSGSAWPLKVRHRLLFTVAAKRAAKPAAYPVRA